MQGIGVRPASSDWTKPFEAGSPVWHPKRAGFQLSDLTPRLAARIRLSAGPCRWIGTAAHDKDGYAKFGGRLLHRLVYLELVGEIPPEKPVLDHVAARGCVSRACCWPPHLEPVTVRVNTLRGVSFSAVNWRKDTCDHGHEFDLLNTYWWRGHRHCRSCRTDAKARYDARRTTTDQRLAA